MKSKALFIRKNGPIIVLPKETDVDNTWRFSYYPGFFSNLFKIIDFNDFTIVLISDKERNNETEPFNNFQKAEKLINDVFISEGITFSEIYCEDFDLLLHSSDQNNGWNYFARIFSDNLDNDNSYIISNLESDLLFAKSIGLKIIYFSNLNNDLVDFASTNWSLINAFLRKSSRIGKVARKTNETNIQVEINLDGEGFSSISTGISFFDHMLDQISTHGAIDLRIHATGDLDVEAHHIVEDTALALGEAVSLALGTKRGIERYGFVLPMDDCLVQAAIDFSGRPWLNWNAKFHREKVGEMPSEMFMHFFKSFCDSAKCNLSIKAEGENEHHKIEAVFKAFAKTLKMASSRTNISSIQSTKGSL